MNSYLCPKILLIDDDPTFRNVMVSVAKSSRSEMAAYESLLDLGALDLIMLYDVAIIDYKLEGMTGLEISEHLNAFFEDIPMLLVSSLGRSDIPQFEKTTGDISYICKSAGSRKIFNTAIQLYLSKLSQKGRSNGDKLFGSIKGEIQ